MKQSGVAKTSPNAPAQRLCIVPSGTYTCTSSQQYVGTTVAYTMKHTAWMFYSTIGIGRIQKNATPKDTVMFHLLPSHTCMHVVGETSEQHERTNSTITGRCKTWTVMGSSDVNLT